MKAAVVLPKRLIYQSDLASVPENRTTLQGVVLPVGGVDEDGQ